MRTPFGVNDLRFADGKSLCEQAVLILSDRVDNFDRLRNNDFVFDAGPSNHSGNQLENMCVLRPYQPRFLP